MGKHLHPGEFLMKMYIEPLDMEVEPLAIHLGIKPEILQELLDCKRSIDPELAMRLSRAFRTSIAHWMNLQQMYDVFEMMHMSSSWKNVKPLIIFPDEIDNEK